jgi:hypothetical protein
MVIQPDKLVARVNGFGFNCDGWNADGVRLDMLKKRGARILDDCKTPDAPVGAIAKTQKRTEWLR